MFPQNSNHTLDIHFDIMYMMQCLEYNDNIKLFIIVWNVKPIIYTEITFITFQSVPTIIPILYVQTIVGMNIQILTNTFDLVTIFTTNFKYRAITTISEFIQN